MVLGLGGIALTGGLFKSMGCMMKASRLLDLVYSRNSLFRGLLLILFSLVIDIHRSKSCW